MALSMEDLQTDVAVIGAGTAGLTARRAAVKAGARTLIVESGPWGTTCVRAGCMPSKLLLAAARAARESRRAPTFGITTAATSIDGHAVMARLCQTRDRFLRSIFDEVDQIPQTDKIQGHARFTSPTTLLIDDRIRVQAKAVVIATGARSSIPPMLESVKHRLLTSETVFELTALPRSLAILGAGPLGIELGAAFTRLGVRTAIFDTGKAIGGLRDPEVQGAAAALLGRELDLHLGTEIAASEDPDGVRIRWFGKSRQNEAVFDHILVAAGRKPNLEGLALEAAGLKLNEHGIPDYDRTTLRCGDSPIFIAGDVDHDRPVLHEASREGRIAGTNAATYPMVKGEPPQTALSIVFTDPDIAVIGEPLAKLGANTAIGRCDFGAGRGLIEDRSGGTIRLYAKREDHTFVGSEMAGPAVEHLAHLVAALIHQKLTVETALSLPFYHPTYEEDLKDCLRDLQQQLR